MSLFLSKSEQQIVVFHIWKSLPYGKRLMFSFALIIAGLIIQTVTMFFFPGIGLVFLGVLLILTKGYNNQVDFGKFNAGAEWEKTTPEKLEEMDKLIRKMKKWDVNPFDITNNLGCLIFFSVLAVIIVVIAIAYNLGNYSFPAGLIAINTLTIVIPFWVTGTRKITKMPRLINKLKLLRSLVSVLKDWLAAHELEYYIELVGKDTKVPRDIKIKVNLKDQPKEFLGLYGQVSINNVSGADYPYFYCVLVSYNTFGLKAHFDKIELQAGIIKEYKLQKDIEIIVIRQYTTKKTGYHTKPKGMENIFKTALYNAEIITGIRKPE
ncbi:MAG: hypothetical protein ABIJ16_02420 [Bacteroidota bacterium]